MPVSENLCPRVFYTMNIISYNMELIRGRSGGGGIYLLFYLFIYLFIHLFLFYFAFVVFLFLIYLYINTFTKDILKKSLI